MHHTNTTEKMSYTIKNTLAELKEACKAGGLKVTGNKPLLLDYLTGRQDGRKKKKKTLPAKPRRKKKKLPAVLGRVSTMKYAAAKDYVDYLSKTKQPAFTTADREMKEKIWGFTGNTSAFSDASCNGVGDHMWGMRESFRRGLFHFGANDQWNLINCTSSENSGAQCWKKVTIDGQKKSIVYDTFTEGELTKMQEDMPNKWRNYNCWMRWKAYAKSRGASICWRDMNAKDELHAVIVTKHLLAMDAELKSYYEE